MIRGSGTGALAYRAAVPVKNRGATHILATDGDSTFDSYSQMGGPASMNSGPGHKEYLRKMLVNKLLKTFPADKSRLIEGEVSYFVMHEHVTKDSMKSLEQRITNKINGGASSQML